MSKDKRYALNDNGNVDSNGKRHSSTIYRLTTIDYNIAWKKLSQTSENNNLGNEIEFIGK